MGPGSFEQPIELKLSALRAKFTAEEDSINHLATGSLKRTINWNSEDGSDQGKATNARKIMNKATLSRFYINK
jgi:hypothetical protein